MIKLYYDQLAKAGFRNTWQRVLMSRFKDPVAWRFVHLNKHVQAAMEKMDAEYTKEVVPAFAVPGFKPDADRMKVSGKSKELDLPFQCVEGKEDEAKAALDSFGKRFVEINERKVPGDVLFSMDAWSPLELEALEPVVSPIGTA